MKQSTQKRKREEEVLDTFKTFKNDNDGISSIISTSSSSTSIQVPSIKFTITETFEICFANEQNKNDLNKKVCNWLGVDYYKKFQPDNHFYYNREDISSNFEKCCGMIVTNKRNEIVGFMTWILDRKRNAEIRYVQVQDKYQGKGIFKKMMSEFTNKYGDVDNLTAYVIPQSHALFENLGWINKEPHERNTKYFYKTIKIEERLSAEKRSFQQNNDDSALLQRESKKYKVVSSSLQSSNPYMSFNKSQASANEEADSKEDNENTNSASDSCSP